MSVSFQAGNTYISQVLAFLLLFPAAQRRDLLSIDERIYSYISKLSFQSKYFLDPQILSLGYLSLTIYPLILPSTTISPALSRHNNRLPSLHRLTTYKLNQNEHRPPLR